MDEVPFDSVRARCSAFAALLGMSGAGVSVYGQPLDASSDTVLALEEWQYVLGDGPSISAFAADSITGIADTHESGSSEWTEFRGHLDDASIGSVFAFPMHLSTRCVGVLTFYGAGSGALTDEHLSDGTMSAGLAAISLQGTTSKGPESALDFRRFDRMHRAAGVIMFELGVDADEALDRIRTHAQVRRRPLRDVVADILLGDVQLV